MVKQKRVSKVKKPQGVTYQPGGLIPGGASAANVFKHDPVMGAFPSPHEPQPREYSDDIIRDLSPISFSEAQLEAQEHDRYMPQIQHGGGVKFKQPPQPQYKPQPQQQYKPQPQQQYQLPPTLPPPLPLQKKVPQPRQRPEESKQQLPKMQQRKQLSQKKQQGGGVGQKQQRQGGGNPHYPPAVKVESSNGTAKGRGGVKTEIRTPNVPKLPQIHGSPIIAPASFARDVRSNGGNVNNGGGEPKGGSGSGGSTPKLGGPGASTPTAGPGSPTPLQQLLGEATPSVPQGPTQRKAHLAATAKAPRAGFRSRYIGVTHRSRRNKFQARIYKGNKEYNLGFYDVAADSALAYDAAHRLVRTSKHLGVDGNGVVIGEGENSTVEKIAALGQAEAEKFTFVWLDMEDNAATNVEEDEPERLNFLKPSEYREARARELEERGLSAKGMSAAAGAKRAAGGKGNVDPVVPTEAEVKKRVRKEVVGVAKAVAMSVLNPKSGRKRPKIGEEGGATKKKAKKRKGESSNSKGGDISSGSGVSDLQALMGEIPGIDMSLLNGGNGEGDGKDGDSSHFENQFVRTMEQLREEERKIQQKRVELDMQLREWMQSSSPAPEGEGTPPVQTEEEIAKKAELEKKLRSYMNHEEIPPYCGEESGDTEKVKMETRDEMARGEEIQADMESSDMLKSEMERGGPSSDMLNHMDAPPQDYGAHGAHLGGGGGGSHDEHHPHPEIAPSSSLETNPLIERYLQTAQGVPPNQTQMLGLMNPAVGGAGPPPDHHQYPHHQANYPSLDVMQAQAATQFDIENGYGHPGMRGGLPGGGGGPYGAHGHHPHGHPQHGHHPQGHPAHGFPHGHGPPGYPHGHGHPSAAGGANKKNSIADELQHLMQGGGDPSMGAAMGMGGVPPNHHLHRGAIMPGAGGYGGGHPMDMGPRGGGGGFVGPGGMPGGNPGMPHDAAPWMQGYGNYGPPGGPPPPFPFNGGGGPPGPGGGMPGGPPGGGGGGGGRVGRMDTMAQLLEMAAPVYDTGRDPRQRQGGGSMDPYMVPGYNQGNLGPNLGP